MTVHQVDPALSNLVWMLAETAGNWERQPPEDGRDALKRATSIVRVAGLAQAQAVRVARAEGLGWDQVADCLGVTEEAARERWDWVDSPE
jgi:hypothetical protein